jgi:hypothetical protein
MCQLLKLSLISLECLEKFLLGRFKMCLIWNVVIFTRFLQTFLFPFIYVCKTWSLFLSYVAKYKNKRKWVVTQLQKRENLSVTPSIDWNEWLNAAMCWA